MMKPRLVLLCVLWLLLTSAAYPQYLEATVKLPDTLGPLTGPYHLAWNESPAHPRLYIGGEGDSGGVIVAQAITCERLARISTGPVKALCFVPPHGKLYVANAGSDTLKVVDCSTNQVVSSVWIAGESPVLQYNRLNDRLYCGGSSVSVIDCAADTVVHAIAVEANVFAFDSADGKLFAGSNGQLAVVDCANDSVAADFPCIDSVGALCYNPTAGKVYATSGDSLYAVRVRDDSLVAARYFGGLVPILACNTLSNRLFFVDGISSRYLRCVDCATDSAVLRTEFDLTPYSLACNAVRNLVYFGSYGEVGVLDGTSGQLQKWITTQSNTGCGWSPGLDRLFCPPVWRQSEPPAKLCLLSTVDGSGDTVAGFLPLTIGATSVTLDTVHNRLFFAYPTLRLGCVGAVDCDSNVVTWYQLVPGAEAVCYNPNNDRLYYGAYDLNADTSVVVAFDCAAKTIVKKVPVNGQVHAFRLHKSLNKLYAETYGGGLYAIDCNSESVRSYTPWPDMYPGVQFVVPEDDTYWYLGPAYTMIVDCVADTVRSLVANHLATVSDACACPEDRRVYAGGLVKEAWAIDMDDPAHVDTLHDRFLGNDGLRFVNLPRARKAYMVVNYSGPLPGHSRIFAIDTRSSALTDSFSWGRQVSGMSIDHTGNYVYCSCLEDSVFFVIDGRRDSVITMVRLPTLPVGPFFLNDLTDRMYVAQYGPHHGSWLPVVRDSMLVGLEETCEASTCVRLGVPTILRGGSRLRASAASELWDATGRKASVLKPGPNDISHLAPGVYFVVEEPQASSHKLQAVRKVVLAR